MSNINSTEDKKDNGEESSQDVTSFGSGIIEFSISGIIAFFIVVLIGCSLIFPIFTQIATYNTTYTQCSVNGIAANCSNMTGWP